MSVRVAPLFAGIAAGAVLSIGVPACSDIDQALLDYCAQNEATAPERLEASCNSSEDCCPGWSCLNGGCTRSLWPDAGVDEDAGTDGGEKHDSGTITDAGVGADGGAGPDGGSCVPKDEVCTSPDECCASAQYCVPNNFGVGHCKESMCLGLDMSCSENDQCCSGQCFGPSGGATCRESAFCSPTESECTDDDDCCGANRCMFDGTSLKCTAPASTGNTFPNNPCTTDIQCSSGQCLDKACSSAATACSPDATGCADTTDCCGGLRCLQSTARCVLPEVIPDRSCSGAGTLCSIFKECCSLSCDAGVCS